MGEDYKKDNSMIIKVNENISWWSGESIALKLWAGNVLHRQQQVRLVPLPEGCSGYSRFTRPWTEYFYGKLLEDADIGVGEDYRKENSTIIRVNASVS